MADAHPDTISLSRVICDFLVLSACAIPLLIFQLFVTPYKRGFYCDDESIRYPYRDSTVSRQMLIVVGLVIPVVLIIITEFFRMLAWERKCTNSFKTYHLRNRSVHRMVVRFYCFIGYFLVGVCFNQLMVDVAKYTIGRQRPHFMDVCRPDIGYTNGPTGTCNEPDTYITNWTCTNPKYGKKMFDEAQLSFYSGHSAFSFYAAWFTALYLQARLYRPLFSRLLLPVIQFALFLGASYVALTRISDYKHHWSDVLVGSALGSVFGIVVAIYIAEVFKRREIPSCGPMSTDFGLIRMERCDVPDAVVSTHTVPVADSDEKDNQRLSVAYSMADSFFSTAADFERAAPNRRRPSSGVSLSTVGGYVSATGFTSGDEYVSLTSTPSWASATQRYEY